jgi:hypothetical protein
MSARTVKRDPEECGQGRDAKPKSRKKACVAGDQMPIASGL